MMASTKRASLLATHKQNCRDSGIYSESCHSELSEKQKRNNRDADVESHENKGKALEGIESNGHITTTNNCGDDATSTDKDDRFKRQSNSDAKSDELKRLLSISETETRLIESGLSNDLIASNAENKSGHTFGRPFKYQCPKTLDPPLYENEESRKALLNNNTDVGVINRCDALINQLQDVTQKYFKLERCYLKVKKICYLMIVVNVVLLVLCITTVVPLLFVLSRTSKEGSQDRDGRDGYALAGENQYQICFACSDLKRGTSLSLETLLDVTEKDETCCFKSITSVVTSLLRVSIAVLFCFIRERPFDFYGGGGGAGRFFKKKSQDPIFIKKNIQDRKMSTIRFVLFANKSTGSRRRRKNYPGPKTSSCTLIKIKWSLPKRVA